MTVAELKAQMMSHTMRRAYIFCGTEVGIRDIYLKQICKIQNYILKWVDEITDILQAGRKKSILQKATLYVLSESSDLVKNEKAWKILDMDLGQNMLICMFTNLDKRTKFYKQYKDLIVEFEPLSPEILKKYIKKEITLSDKNCQMLMEVCENDYGRCLLEIDKVKHFVKGYGKDKLMQLSEEAGMLRLINDGTIYRPPKDAIFDFVDAVLDRDAYNSFKLMQESYDSGEATMVMISNLYTNFKALLQVQGCKSKDISNCTGLTGWQIMNAKKHLNHYTNKELTQALTSIRSAEVGIKSGTIEESVAVQWLLVSIL